MKQQHHRLGILTAGVFMLLGLALGIAYSPVLRLERITVIAPTSSLGEEVRRQLRVGPGASTLLLPMNRIVRQAMSCYRVETVKVERSFPHDLSVTVTAREPIAALRDPEGFTLVSGEGICLCRQARRPDLPIFRGLTPPRPALGSQVEPDRWSWAREVLVGATKVGLRDGLEADFSQPHGVTLTTPSGLHGNLGNVNSLTRKMTILGRVVQQLESEGRRVLAVDVSTPEAPIWTAV